jgi:hypothetical protein
MADRPIGELLLKAAQGYRKFWDENPVLGISLGFVPGVGTALAAADTAAAAIDPEASKLELSLASAGIIPFGKGIGAVRKVVIGEKGAKAVEKEGLEVARKMLGDRRPMSEIYEKTGWQIGPGGKWILELPETSVSVKRPTQLPKNRLGDYEGPVHTVIKGHPAIDPERYPGFWNDVSARMEQSGTGGAFSPPDGLGAELSRALGKPGGRIRIEGEGNIDEVASHEVQHGVQYAENWGHPYEGASSSRANTYIDYLLNPGEIVARVSSWRRNMTPEELKKYPYMKMYWDEYNRVNKYLQAGKKSAPMDPSDEEWWFMFKDTGLDSKNIRMRNAGLAGVPANKPSSPKPSRPGEVDRVVDPAQDPPPAPDKFQEIVDNMLRKAKAEQAAKTQFPPYTKPTEYRSR